MSKESEETAPIKREHLRVDRKEPSKVFIYCDDPSHPPRRARVAVTNFYAIGDGRWTVHYTGSPSRRDSGTTLADDARLPPGWTIPEALAKFEVIRSRYRLVCRKCRARPVVAKEERLFGALNALAAGGKSVVSLSELAAILVMQSDV